MKERAAPMNVDVVGISDPKQRFDALAVIWSAAHKRIAKRQESEWRATIAIWTALAALSGIVLAKPGALGALIDPPGLLWLLGLGAVSLLVLHWSFLQWVGTRHDNDREIASQLLGELTLLCRGIPPASAHPFANKALDWSRRVQFGISVLLVGLLFLFLAAHATTN